MEQIIKLIAIVLLILRGGFQLMSQSYTMEQCQQQAILAHPDMKDAAINTELASAGKAMAISNFLPSLQFNFFQGGNFGRSIDRFTNSYINQFYNSTYTGASLSVPVFNGFSNKYALQAANKSIEAADLLSKGSKNQLALQVGSSYLEVLAAGEWVKSVGNLILNDSTQLKTIEARLEAGTANRTEQLQMLNQLKSDEIALQDARMAYESAVISLFQWMNTEVPADPVFEDVSLAVEIVNEGNLLNQLEGLPEVRRFDILAESQEWTAKSVLATKLPRIVLQGDYGTFYASSNPERNFVQQINDTRNGSVSLGLSWNILSFARVNASTRQSRAAVERTLNDKDRYVLSLERDIQTALSRYKGLKEKFVQATELEAMSQETLDNLSLQFQTGTVGMADYMLARNNLESAKSNLIRAKYEMLLQQKVLQYYSSGSR